MKMLFQYYFTQCFDMKSVKPRLSNDMILKQESFEHHVKKDTTPYRYGLQTKSSFLKSALFLGNLVVKII